MKPLEQKRYETLEKMLNWRLSKATTSGNELAEIESLNWAMNVIIACYSEGCCHANRNGGLNGHD